MKRGKQGRRVLCDLADIGTPDLRLIASYDDECRVATSMLLYPNQADPLVRLCGVADFAFSLTRAVFTAICALRLDARRCHLLGVEAWLARSPDFPSYRVDEIMGVTDVVSRDIGTWSALRASPTALLAARRVADLAQQRELCATLGRIRDLAGPSVSLEVLRGALRECLAALVSPDSEKAQVKCRL